MVSSKCGIERNVRLSPGLPTLQAHIKALAKRQAAEAAAEEARRTVAACRVEDIALRDQLAELSSATDAAREARFAMDAKRADTEQVCTIIKSLQLPVQECSGRVPGRGGRLAETKSRDDIRQSTVHMQDVRWKRGSEHWG